MNFRTIADLNDTILCNLHRVPRDVEIIVGAPRSGLMAASLIALALNLPLVDIDGFIAGRVFASGRTRRRAALDKPVAAMRHAFVVDDSIQSGTAMHEVREKLEAAFPNKRFTYCAVYGPKRELPGVMTFEGVPNPRVFQWNVMHSDMLAMACVDIDGVLCLDPSDEENDDAGAYLRFLENASPLFTPTKRIGTLVTSRLEKYRQPTEAWLARHDIEYDKLVMLDLPDAETRRRQNCHGFFKGRYYRQSRAALFLESEVAQAETIAKISGKPVLCMKGPRMVYPDALSSSAVRHQARNGLRNALTPVKRVARMLMGPKFYDVIKRPFAGL